MGFFRGLNTIFLTAAAGFSAVAGNNAVFNGGFELGTEGWSLIKHLRVDTNPELKIRKLSVDTAISAEGKQSLYLDNRQGEAFRIYSLNFPLKANTNYRFSGKVRCDRENFDLVIMPFCTKVVNKRRTWNNKHCFVRTKEKWITVSREFNTGKDGGGWWRFLISPNGFGYQRKEIMPVQLWFDDFRIEEINRDPQTPEVHIAAVPEKTVYEREAGTPVRIAVKMYNTSDREKNTDFTVTGRDVYFQNVLFEKKFSVNLAPKEKKELFFEVPAERYGCCRVDVSGNDVHSLPRRYAVIGNYAGGEVDVTRDYVVSANVNFDFGAPPTFKYPAYGVANCDFGDKIRLFRQMGLRLMRDMCGGGAMTGWDGMNAEEGKWDFTHADRCWEVARVNGMMVLPILGGYLLEKDHKNLANTRYHIPQYMIPRSRLVKGLSTRMLRLPPETAWKEYIAQAVGHFKGKIPVYEITNEPNIDIPPEIYLNYLKWSYETIRKTDPQAKVAGFCLSSDFSTQTGPWASELMKLGGLKYLDILSFHPYNSRTLNSVIAADKDIQNILAMAAKSGKKDLELWQTELFYFFPVGTTDGANASEHTAPGQSALWAIRTFVDLGEGVTQTISPDESQFFSSLLQENCYEINPDELIPNDFFAAGNALARLFEGAKIAKKSRNEETGIATYVFRRKGKNIAAVWNYLDRKGVFLKRSAELKVLDFYGNEITSAEIPVETSPLYLVNDSLNEAQFDEAITKLEYLQKQTVMASPLVRTAGKKAFVSLHNIVSRPGSGYAGITGGKSAQRFSLSGKGSGYVETELNTPDPSMKIMVSAGGKPNFFPAKECPCKMVPAKTTLKLGEGDFRAEASMELKKDVFELTLRVYDSTDAGPTGKRKMWETDCVELFFDEKPLPLRLFHGSDYDQFVSRVFMQPRDEGKVTVWSRRFSVKDCRSELKQLPDGYQWKFQIPVSCERFLGFDLKISDGIAGSTKIKSGISWSGNEKRIRDRTVFGLIEKEEIEK